MSHKKRSKELFGANNVLISKQFKHNCFDNQSIDSQHEIKYATSDNEAVKATRDKVTVHEMLNFDKKSKNPIKVSIIMPVCNVEQYLRECIDSCINQTLQDIEIICVNDGSTDSCMDILREYAEKDDRVKVINKDNAGYGHTMNIGMDMAQGEYIGVVESDDYILPNMMEVLYTTAKENNVDWVKSNFKRFYGEVEDRTFENVPLFENENTYNCVIDPNPEYYPNVFYAPMNIWTGIYLRKFILKHNIRFNESPGASFQDNGFWFQAFIFSHAIYFLNEYFYMNRRDNPNSSVKGTEKAFCVIDEFNYIENILNQHLECREKFIEHFVKCKVIGYIGAYNRSSTEHKMKFVFAASKDLKRHLDAGEINRTLYGPKRWEALNILISDPVNFILRDLNHPETKASNTRLTELNELIACRQNELYNLEKENFFFIDHCSDIKVSIIVPAYNMENYIDECIESIIHQTFKDIEIIIVDDGSQDHTFNKIIQWAKKDYRIKVMATVNGGSGKARNLALNVAKGKYVMFMDADDWYPNEMVIEHLYTIAETNRVNIAGGCMRAYLNGVECQSPEYYNFSQTGIISYSEYQLDYGYTRYIYNLDFLRSNEIVFPDYKRFQDPIFFVNAMSAAGKFYATNEVVYSYRKTKKKKVFNEQQNNDILRGLTNEYVLASKNNLSLMKVKLHNRVLDEFYDNFSKYLYSNSAIVTDSFIKLFSVLDESCKEDLIKKFFFDVSVKMSIPLSKAQKRLENYEIKDRQYEKTISRLNKENAILNKEKENLIKEKENLIKEKNYLNKELFGTRGSISFKIGLFFTWLPRKIRTAIRNAKNK